jgi:hypothetical protein
MVKRPDLTTLRPTEQVPTEPASVEWIMSDRHFEYGVNDKRAGRGYRAGFETWDLDPQWNYERGRAWATLAPRTVKLRLPSGELNPEAVRWFERFSGNIL